MTIEKRTTPYEILYRLNEDGTVAGAHMRSLEKVVDTDTGEVYSEKELNPVAIEGPDMEAVMGVINVAQAATIAQLQDAIAVRDEMLQALQDQLAAASNTIIELQAQQEQPA